MKHDWIQIISTLGVVIGLIIVIFELQESQDQAQLMLDDYLSLHEHQYTLMGDNPAAAIAKAKISAEQLTEEEKIVVNAHLRVEYERVAAYEYIGVQTGYLDEDWQSVVPVVLEEFYYYSYARNWIIEHQNLGNNWNPEFEELVNNYLRSTQ